MKVLFLSPDVPFPVRHGGHVRNFGLIRCLSEFATVRVLAIGDPSEARQPATQEAFAALGASIEAFAPVGPAGRLGLLERRPWALWHYFSPSLAERVEAEGRAFAPDVVHVEEAVMAQYASTLACPAVLDRQKIDWIYQRHVRHLLRPRDLLSPSAWLATLRARLEARRFRRWDEALRGSFAAVLVLSESDRDRLSPIYGPRVHVVANGVSSDIALPPSRSGGVRFVLLYGSLDYPPNAEANEAYFRDVWPRLRAADADLRTVVVGYGTPLRPLPADDPRVEVRGFVPDIMTVLGSPGVLVVPLRVGGGIRNKILEALAAGMPVVSSRVGAEDLGLVDGRHFLAAETPDQIVEAVLRLKRSPELVLSLGREGARLVDERYRWDGVARRLRDIYAGVAGRASDGDTPVRAASIARW